MIADEPQELVAAVAAVWPDGLQIDPVDYRAVAGSVVVFGRVHDDVGGFEDEVVWVWKLRDGLIASGQVFPTRGAAVAAARAAA